MVGDTPFLFLSRANSKRMISATSCGALEFLTRQQIARLTAIRRELYFFHTSLLYMQFCKGKSFMEYIVSL